MSVSSEYIMVQYIRELSKEDKLQFRMGSESLHDTANSFPFMSFIYVLAQFTLNSLITLTVKA